MSCRFDLILLDADGTLFDFSRAERYAFHSALKEFGVAPSEEDTATFSRENHERWERLAAGELTKDQVVVQRFVEPVKRYKLPISPRQFNERFQSYMRQADFLLDGAEELCRELDRHCTLAIATNGVARTQRGRLEKSVIRPYISHLIISEEAGEEKPGTGFFAHALAVCGIDPVDKGRVLMVGDSLSADILGAARFGIDACWVNLSNAPRPGDLMARYEINELPQLLPLVRE